MTASPWAVVLAGGDGDRVSAITRDAEGRVVPGTRDDALATA